MLAKSMIQLLELRMFLRNRKYLIDNDTKS